CTIKYGALTERRRRRRRSGNGNEKSLAIPAHARERANALTYRKCLRHFEQELGRAKLKPGIRADADDHHSAIKREIVEFLSVCAPKDRPVPPSVDTCHLSAPSPDG